MDECLFCRIVSGSIPSPRLHEDELCIAIADIAPKAPVHLLILPREHLASTDGVDAAHEGLAGHLVRVAAGLARSRGLDTQGYRLVFNSGAQAGQTVFHLHLHLLGGRAMQGMG
jgi:diadenosine tetraphosphate (Ap4A) HIT family hydrolase